MPHLISLNENIRDPRSASEDKNECLEGVVFIQFMNASCRAVSDTLIQIMEAFPAACLIVGVPNAYFQLTELRLNQQGRKLKIFPNDSPLLATMQTISQKISDMEHFT